jgi:hypothetical protein
VCVCKCVGRFLQTSSRGERRPGGREGAKKGASIDEVLL